MAILEDDGALRDLLERTRAIAVLGIKSVDEIPPLDPLRRAVWLQRFGAGAIGVATTPQPEPLRVRVDYDFASSLGDAAQKWTRSGGRTCDASHGSSPCR